MWNNNCNGQTKCSWRWGVCTLVGGRDRAVVFWKFLEEHVIYPTPRRRSIIQPWTCDDTADADISPPLICSFLFCSDSAEEPERLIDRGVFVCVHYIPTSDTKHSTWLAETTVGDGFERNKPPDGGDNVSAGLLSGLPQFLRSVSPHLALPLCS